jgi:hypothetical protein
MDAITSEFYNEVKKNPKILESWKKGLLTISEAVEIIAKQAEATHESEFKKEKRADLAARVYSLDIYEARNNDETPETIAETIRTNPAEIIKYLLDIIDDLQN